MIEPVLAAARGAGLRVEGIDLAAFAMIRALRDENAGEDAVLYAEVAGMTNVAVAQGPQCLFARASGTGIEGIAVELAERRGLTLEHSRAWLQHVGLADAGRAASRATPRSSPTPAPSSSTGVRRISGEIRQSLDFHHMQSGGATVTTRHRRPDPCLAIPGFADAVGADIGLPGHAGRHRRRRRGRAQQRRHRRRRPRIARHPGRQPASRRRAPRRRRLRPQRRAWSTWRSASWPCCS